MIYEKGKVKAAEVLGVSFSTLDKLTKEWNITTTMKSPIEQLKEKIKDRNELIDLIETVGKDQICKDYNTGYDTLDSLIDEWDVKAKFLNAGEGFLRKIGGREQLINLVKNYSLTQLSKKYKVGRNTIKRLLEKLDIRHGKHF